MNPRTAGWILLATLSVPWATGCSPSLQAATKDVTQAAVPAAIDSGIKTFEEDRTRERVLALMSSPELQKSLELMAKSFTKGATDALTSEEMAKRSSELASSIASTATRVAVDAALSEITSPANERRMAELLSVATAAATRSAVQAMADELPRSLGPAVSEMMRQDVNPNVRGMVADPDTRSTLAAIAFEVSRQTVLGSNEALAELEQKKQKKGLLAHLSGLFADGSVLYYVVLGLFGLGVAGLVVALALTRSKLKHARPGDRADEDGEDRGDKAEPRGAARRGRPAEAH